MAKQPKPAFHFPGDVKIAGPSELGERSVKRSQGQQKSEAKGGISQKAHDFGRRAGEIVVAYALRRKCEVYGRSVLTSRPR
jgi:hypothetical protein